jgi:archaeosine-15-forming tRNA-guanine transglycosylase
MTRKNILVYINKENTKFAATGSKTVFKELVISCCKDLKKNFSNFLAF